MGAGVPAGGGAATGSTPSSARTTGTIATLAPTLAAPAASSIARLLSRERLDPRPNAGVGTAEAEEAAPGFVDDLELEIGFMYPERVERSFLGFVERSAGDFDPFHDVSRSR